MKKIIAIVLAAMAVLAADGFVDKSAEDSITETTVTEATVTEDSITETTIMEDYVAVPFDLGQELLCSTLMEISMNLSETITT